MAKAPLEQPPYLSYKLLNSEVVGRSPEELTETDISVLILQALDDLSESNIRTAFINGRVASREEREQAERNRRDFSDSFRSTLAQIAMNAPGMDLIPPEQRQTALDYITGSFAVTFSGKAAGERRAEVRKNPAAGVDFVVRALKVFVASSRPGAIKNFRG